MNHNFWAWKWKCDFVHLFKKLGYFDSSFATLVIDPEEKVFKGETTVFFRHVNLCRKIKKKSIPQKVPGVFQRLGHFVRNVHIAYALIDNT